MKRNMSFAGIAAAILSLKKTNHKEGKLMKTIFTILLAVALVAGLAIFAATDARAYNLDGFCDASELATGECSITAGGWVMEIVRGVTGVHAGDFPVNCDGTDTSIECVDRRGNPIKGYRFEYLITAPPYKTTLAQANMLCPKCGEGNSISITFPTDSSVKMLTEDPNTKYGAGSSDYVIAWNALKLDPNNKADIAVYTTKAGAGLKGALLKTGAGNEYVENILGPDCCTKTQVPTKIDVEFQTGCSGTLTVDTLFAEYDQCTGDATGVYRYDSAGNKVYFNPVMAWICEGDESGYDRNTCITMKTIGPREGAVIFAGYQYFGYGSHVYRGPLTDPTCLTQSTCPADADPGAPFKPRKTMDERTVFEFDYCGYLSDVTDTEGRSYARVTAWICESTANGGLDGKTCSRILGGAIDGAIIYANPTYSIGGQLITTATCSSTKPCPYGQTCYSGSCYCRANSQCPSGKICKYVFGTYGVCK